MEDIGISPRAALRLAGAMRGALAPLLAGLSAAGQSGPETAAAYRLLRTAQNLECCARLARPLKAERCTDLASLCAALCEAAQHCCGHRRLRPALAVQGGVLPVAVPAWVLANLTLNLLGNALLYGGPRPAARLEVSRQGGSAVLTVRDAGPGIPPAAQERVFAPFACLPAPLRGKGAVQEPGAGLGLSLAALAARQAGGVCTLASRPGRGTAVALTLPLCEGAMPGPCPTATELLADRYSPVYVQLCQTCVLPD